MLLRSLSLLAVLAAACTRAGNEAAPSIEAVNQELAALAERRALDAGAEGDLVAALAPNPDVIQSPPPGAAPAETPRGPRPRLPPPLKPRSAQAPNGGISGTSPCLVLVDRVCDFVTLAAEECLEARAHIRARPSAAAELACQEALDFFRERVDVRPDVKPCTLLGDLRCGALRSRSRECKAIRKGVKQLTKNLPEACMAEILVSRGLPELAAPWSPPPSPKPPAKPPPRRRPRREP